jgi:hypothetical protein
MKIRFKVHHRPKGDAEDIPSYKAGETYTFNGPVSEGYAKKYVRLGYAVEAVEEPAKQTIRTYSPESVELGSGGPSVASLTESSFISAVPMAQGEKVTISFPKHKNRR